MKQSINMVSFVQEKKNNCKQYIANTRIILNIPTATNERSYSKNYIIPIKTHADISKSICNAVEMFVFCSTTFKPFQDLNIQIYWNRIEALC